MGNTILIKNTDERRLVVRETRVFAIRDENGYYAEQKSICKWKGEKKHTYFPFKSLIGVRLYSDLQEALSEMKKLNEIRKKNCINIKFHIVEVDAITQKIYNEYYKSTN